MNDEAAMTRRRRTLKDSDHRFSSFVIRRLIRHSGFAIRH